MITDEILNQKYDELRECLLGLEGLFQAEKERVVSVFYSESHDSGRENQLRGEIVGILDCIIILRGELKKLGLVDEDPEMAD